MDAHWRHDSDTTNEHLQPMLTWSSKIISNFNILLSKAMDGW